jgi:hypothetical protein
LSRIGLGSKAGTVGGEAIRGAAYGGIYGAGEGGPEASIQDRLTSAAIGSVTGGAGGAGGARLMRGLGGDAGVGEAVQAARAADIPVMASDVSPPSTFMGKGMQQVGERIPFTGTGGLRQTQQEARAEAVKNLMAEYGVGEPGIARKVASSLSATRSAQIDKYTTMKREVIEPLRSAGAVPVEKATKAIDDEIIRLERISPEGFRPATAILRRWKGDLVGKSLDDIEVLRRQVGEEFAAPELASVSGEAQKSLSRIYGPLRDDMGAFIREKGAPKDVVKWQIANRRLSESMEELKKSALKSVLRDVGQTPEAIERLLFSTKPSDVAALYRNLNPEGRAAARVAIMDKVFRDMGGNLDEVTPEKFLRDVRKQASQLRIFFGGNEAASIEGLVKALKLTQRAGTANLMTNSGQQAVPIVGGASLLGLVSGAMGEASTGIGTAATSIGLAGGVGALARMLESKPMRNALLRMKAAKPAQENAAAQNVINTMRTVFGQSGANLSPEGKTMPISPSKLENMQ